MTTIPHRGIPDILVELLKEFTSLMRKEVRLAKTEVSEKITLVGVGLALIAGAAVLAMAGLVMLLEAAVAALIDRGGLSPAAAASTVGLIVLGIAAILLALGTSRLKSANLTPTRTVEQFQRDATVAKQQVTSR